MRWLIAKSRFFRAAGGLWLFIVLGLIASTRAQTDQPTPAPQPVRLPPAFGGTPLSYQIQAEASYVASCGDLVKSAAWARKVNAEAVALEIQNSISYVDAYFKRRELNRTWRAKENPNYLESEKRRQEVLKRRVETQYQDLLRGDVTSPLNWLLRELSDPVVAYHYLPAGQTLVHASLDRAITPRDLEQIRLTDGGSKASRLVFAAADGKPLERHWPIGLRGPECALARENYQRAMDEVVAEIKQKGPASYESQTKAMQSVNALFVALDDAYPKERRKDPAEFLTYATAKRYLQSLLATTHRVLNAHDARLLDGGLSFQGDSLVGLLQHMYQAGLEFAPPEPGGEGVYKTLFQNLRALYMIIGPDRAAADVKPAQDGAFGNDKGKPVGQ
jgi:hypothetical protein